MGTDLSNPKLETNPGGESHDRCTRNVVNQGR